MLALILNNTPVETYQVGGRDVFVKREDLCCPGGPTFSKVRGIIDHLTALQKTGVQVVGYCETSISMAGWGIAWACEQLSMTAVIYDPQYVETCNTLKRHRTMWAKHNATIRSINASMAKVNWYVCKKRLVEEFGPQAVMLPLGLPFEETIQATSQIVIDTLIRLPNIPSVVINVGSGTICAGLWQGLEVLRHFPVTIYGIMGRTGNISYKTIIIEKKAHLYTSGLMRSRTKLKLIDPGWEYTDASTAECPFPCNKFYDLKAWQWLCENINLLTEPILFWNIGS
jgi:threonine dehydratase